MSRTRNRNHNEIEHLRGEIRKLRAQLKYYKKRDHLNDPPTIVEEEPTGEPCPDCGKGILMEYDFKYAILKKCDHCPYEQRKRKT